MFDRHADVVFMITDNVCSNLAFLKSVVLEQSSSIYYQTCRPFLYTIFRN